MRPVAGAWWLVLAYENAAGLAGCAARSSLLPNSVTPHSGAGKIGVHFHVGVDGVALADPASLAQVWPVIARIVAAVAHSAADGIEFTEAQFAIFVAHVSLLLVRNGPSPH